MAYTLQEIATFCSGSLHEGGTGVHYMERLLTDSRNVEAGADSLFFAINTEANDGVRYVPELYARGVRNFVVNELPDTPLPEASYIVVKDVIKALQLTAAARRDRFGGDMVAVTGSRGKTVVKEWIYRGLQGYRRAVRSPRSFNSQIGVPLSLWQLGSDVQTAVIEAGISRAGEMQTLADIIRPDVVVITNVGDEHAEGFSSLQAHAAEKARLAFGARYVVYCADDEIVAQALKPALDAGAFAACWSRLSKDAPVYLSSVVNDGGLTRLTYTYKGLEESITVPELPEWGVEDMMHTLTTLLVLGMEPGRIAWALRDARPVRTRIDVSDGVNDCLLASDTFTCDLLSLESALDFINRRADEQGRTRTLLLGELQLDDVSEQDACRRIASLLRSARISRFIGVAPMYARHKEIFEPGALFFNNADELGKALSTSDFVSEFILIKGAPGSLDSVLLNLEARTHETVLEVNLDSIVKNFNYFRSFLPHTTGLIAMVKASAYGAGSLEIAKTLQAQGASYLAVAVLDEGIDLRRAGITMPIMVMNPKVLNYRAMFAHRLEPEIYSMQMLRDVIREAEKCGITAYPLHIKLDTGMHRTGFNEPELPELLRLLESSSAVKVSTMFSHLATSDCLDMDEYTLAQIERFEAYTQQIMQALPYKVKRHILNTAGIVRFPQYHYDFARLGVGLYGVNTLPEDVEQPLATVSTLRTMIIEVKEREAGEAIGYARRDILRRRSRIATIPIGYADGMNRRFGNGRSHVVVNGCEVPTIGNICMDACMIDVTGVPCEVGDVVEIFGAQMPVQRLADTLETIPYEVLTSVSPRVKRIYFRE